MAAKKKQESGKRESPREAVAACQRCGGTNITYATSQNISCGECGYFGAPRLFASAETWQEFRTQRELSRMQEMKLWGQKVFHRTIPVVVLVNWLTTMFFFTFFALGMLGWFRHDWFQWLFLFLSIFVVALGFGALVRWGRSRVDL